jgi:hypothetical protein
MTERSISSTDGERGRDGSDSSGSSFSVQFLDKPDYGDIPAESLEKASEPKVTTATVAS